MITFGIGMPEAKVPSAIHFTVRAQSSELECQGPELVTWHGGELQGAASNRASGYEQDLKRLTTPQPFKLKTIGYGSANNQFGNVIPVIPSS